MKRHIASFGNEVVRLELIKEADLSTTLEWRNRDEARVWFKTSDVLSFDQHYGWFKRYQEKDDDFLFIVTVNSKPVGQASVYEIDWRSGRAEVGRFLAAPEESGKGYISQACAELVRFCERSLGLTYLFLEVMENNDKAVRVYERNGFSEESRYNGLIRMGRTVDV